MDTQALEDYSLEAVYKITASMTPEEKWVTYIDGDITNYEEEYSELAAKVKFIVINLDSAIEDGINLFDALDMDSRTAPFISLFNTDDDHIFLDSAVQEALSLASYSFNLFILDRIEILPTYRGKGLTSLIFSDAHRLFGGYSSIAALKSFPLQEEHHFLNGEINDWERKLKYDEFTRDKETAYRKLYMHYQSIGFKQVGKEGLMVMSI